MLIELDTAASRNYAPDGTANVTHDASQLKSQANAGSVSCANGSVMRTTATGMTGKIPMTYLTNCDSVLLSIGELSDVTSKDFVFNKNGAWVSKQPRQVSVQDKDCFEKLAKRQPGTNETYLITPDTANRVLGSQFKSIPRRRGRRFEKDKAAALASMEQQLYRAHAAIMEPNPGSTIQARLCNIPGRRIAELLRGGRITGIKEDTEVLSNLVVPESVILGRMKNVPRTKKRETKSTKSVTYGAFDILGPFDKRKFTPKSIHIPRYKYALVIVSPVSKQENSGTKVKVIYLKSKKSSEIEAKFRTYLTELKSQSLQPEAFGHVHMYERLKSDNAKEFDGLGKLFNEFGCKHKPTVPYKHYQNGPVERVIQTLQGHMRTLLEIGKDVPVRFWFFAMQYAVRIHNRLPSARGGKSAYEAQWGEPPDLSNLRTWGSLVYMRVQDEEKEFSKEARQNRVRLGILVDCDLDTQTYLIWDPATDTLLVRRDILADERFSMWPANRVDMLRKNSYKKKLLMRPASQLQSINEKVSEKLTDEDKKAYSYALLHPLEENAEEQEVSEARTYLIENLIADVFKSEPKSVPEDKAVTPEERAEEKSIQGKIAPDSVHPVRRSQRIKNRHTEETQRKRSEFVENINKNGIPDSEEILRKVDLVISDLQNFVQQRGRNQGAVAAQAAQPSASSTPEEKIAKEDGQEPKDNQEEEKENKLLVPIIELDRDGQEEVKLTEDQKLKFLEQIAEEEKSSPPVRNPTHRRLRAKSAFMRRIREGIIVVRQVKDSMLKAYKVKRAYDDKAQATPSDSPIGKPVSMFKTPKTDKDVLASPQAPWWARAKQEELNALQKAGTWIPRKLPKGARVLGYKWVYKIKSERGLVTRFKARLVCLGYKQIPDLDYFSGDISAPVLRPSTFMFLLNMIVRSFYHPGSLDFKSAFLKGTLKKEIFIKPMPSIEMPDGTNVLQLIKSLYGLVQSPARWYDTMCTYLAKCGYFPSKVDKCLFIHRDEHGFPDAYLGTWVDDGVFVGKDSKLFDKLIQELQALGSDIDPTLGAHGELDYVLGIDVTLTRVGESVEVELSHRAAVEALIDQHIPNAHPVATPCLKVLSRAKEPLTETERRQMEKLPYRNVVGALLHISRWTRPDISFSVGHSSRFNHDPRPNHWKALMRILRYLKGTLDKWVIIKIRNLPIAADPEHEEKCAKIRRAIGDYPTIVGYSDSDLAGCPDTTRSTGGYVFYFDGCLVSWRSKRQSKVATSTAVAEYYALNDAAKEGLYLKRLAAEFDPSGRSPKLVILGDNETANNMGLLEKFSDKTKHVRIAESYLHEMISTKQLELHHVPSGSNIADIMMKPLGRVAFERLRNLLLGSDAPVSTANNCAWKTAKTRNKVRAPALDSVPVKPMAKCKTARRYTQSLRRPASVVHGNYYQCFAEA